jgi:hypothetical protein
MFHYHLLDYRAIRAQLCYNIIPSTTLPITLLVNKPYLGVLVDL